MPVVFVANPLLELELKNDPKVKAFVNGKARAAKGAAQSIAAGFSGAGVYSRKLEVDGNRLQNTDPGAWAQELGAPSKNTPARAPLRKAAISVGAVIGGD